MNDTTTHYRWSLLRAGSLLLDGGGMFGVVPRVVWNRTVPCDNQGRITLAHNCLLLKAVGQENAGRILIESGSGDKFDEKNRAIFGLTGDTVGQAVTKTGCACEQIEHVFVSHLHFDHVGGLTRRLSPGETADWPPGNGGEGVKITFPNAKVIVQRREWEDATGGQSVMTRTYLHENLLPLRDRLHLVDAPLPFAPGYHPKRDESPSLALAHRQVEVLPGIEVFSIPGHTWGQQAIVFLDERGRGVVFGADLIPTAAHVGAAYNLAYDVEPYTSTVTRRWFLQAVAENDWLLVLDHEPGNPLCKVKPDGKGWWMLVPEA